MISLLITQKIFCNVPPRLLPGLRDPFSEVEHKMLLPEEGPEIGEPIILTEMEKLIARIQGCSTINRYLLSNRLCNLIRDLSTTRNKQNKDESCKVTCSIYKALSNFL